jgi:hypothetical protein
MMQVEITVYINTGTVLYLYHKTEKKKDQRTLERSLQKISDTACTVVLLCVVYFIQYYNTIHNNNIHDIYTYIIYLRLPYGSRKVIHSNHSPVICNRLHNRPSLLISTNCFTVRFAQHSFAT